MCTSPAHGATSASRDRDNTRIWVVSLWAGSPSSWFTATNSAIGPVVSADSFAGRSILFVQMDSVDLRRTACRFELRSREDKIGMVRRYFCQAASTYSGT